MRVVQLSDMHLSKDVAGLRYGVSPWERLEFVFDDIASDQNQPDLLVFTGDVAHDHLEETYRQLKVKLDARGYDYRILPGNHDSPELLPRVFGARGGRFELTSQGWSVIGVNSHLPGEIGGALSEDELAWMRSKLLDAAGPRKALFVHHPPVSVDNIFFDAVGLRAAPQVREELEKISGLEFVSFGHIHRPFSVVADEIE